MIHRIIVNKLKLELLPRSEEEIYNKTETAKWNMPQFDEVIISSADKNRGYRVTVIKGMQVGFMKIAEHVLIDWEYNKIVDLVSKLAEREFLICRCK